MRQITTREKAFLSVAALVAVAILVWFVLLPMLQNGEEQQKSSLEQMQERLAAVQKLASMSSMLVDLEENIAEQSGYKKAEFKRGSASPTMIIYIADAAKQAGIGELEQLDARPDTKRKTSTEARDRQDVLGAIIDRMYMAQVRNETGQDASADEDAAENKPPDERPEKDSQEEAEEVEPDGQNSNPPDKNEDNQAEEPTDPDTSEESVNVEQGGQDNSSPDEDEGDQVKDQTDSDVPEEPGTAESAEDVKQVGSTGTVFPPVPRGEDISDEVKQSLARSIEARQGKTLEPEDINEILDEAGLLDAEKAKVGKRLQLYSKGVDEKKSEISEHFEKLGVSKSATSGQQMEIFSIKMVFKGRIDQLVKFMYNLEDSAKWLRVDSMRIGISDRKETVLSVELSMTATALYDLERPD